MAQNKRYLGLHRVNYTVVLVITVLTPCMWLGWKLSEEKWIDRITAQLAELITLTFFTYFRRQLMDLLKTNKVDQ
ncbi:MAG: hypothetical protein P4L79_01380 [Legionella sp.]|uniref:hypothetical protein n=1 Tax=Legionella sp. TaxID=459 RepID=UPI0028418727|nr:hypothetical protein [Legionella sp.]